MGFIVGYLVGTAITLAVLRSTKLLRIFWMRLTGQAKNDIYVSLCCKEHKEHLERWILVWIRKTFENGEQHGDTTPMESPSTGDQKG